MSGVTPAPLRIIYFSGRTRNTERFASKLAMAMFRIPSEVAEITQVTDQPFVLVTPTYANGKGENAVPKQVEHFLKYDIHWRNMRGVIGSGNKNFGNTFCRAADVLSQRYHVPVLHKFELFGMPSDLLISTQRITSCL